MVIAAAMEQSGSARLARAWWRVCGWSVVAIMLSPLLLAVPGAIGWLLALAGVGFATFFVSFVVALLLSLQSPAGR